MIVEGARSGIGFALTAGGEVFEKPEPSSLVSGTLDFLRGLQVSPFFLPTSLCSA